MPRKTRRSLPIEIPKGMFQESFIYVKNGKVQQESNVKGTFSHEKILYEGEENGKPIDGEIVLQENFKPKPKSKPKSTRKKKSISRRR